MTHEEALDCVYELKDYCVHNDCEKCVLRLNGVCVISYLANLQYSQPLYHRDFSKRLSALKKSENKK